VHTRQPSRRQTAVAPNSHASVNVREYALLDF
jgi:hypothetical protein